MLLPGLPEQPLVRSHIQKPAAATWLVIPQSCGPQRPRLPARASVQHLEDGQLWAGLHSTGVPVEQDILPEQMGSEQDNRLWVLSSTSGLPDCKPEQPQL